MAAYGGLDDAIIDPFGFPLRLKLDANMTDYKERWWFQSVRPLSRNDKELQTPVAGKVAALSGFHNKDKDKDKTLNYNWILPNTIYTVYYTLWYGRGDSVS